MRQFRYLLLTLVLTGCPGSDPKSGDDTDTLDDSDTPGVDTPDTPDTLDDTGDTDPVTDSSDTDETGADSDSDTDTTPGQGTGDTGPIDSFVPPNGSGDTGGGPPPTPTPPGPTGMTPETGDTSANGETGVNIDTDSCLPDEILDCNGECFPAVLLGDGTCHIGGFGNPDFFCEDLNWDEGDCPNGDTANPPPPQQCNGPVDVEDCNGVCYPITWVGDGRCDDGSNGGANFDCILFASDNGDCTTVTETADTADSDDTDTADSDDTATVIDTNDTAN